MTSDLAQPDHVAALARSRSMLVIGGGLLVLFGALLALGGLPRLRDKHALAAAADRTRSAKTRVYVIRATPAGPADFTLAGTTVAFRDAIVYARSSGYVRRRWVDIGDTVQAGQLLAEIASPEVDQQLSQARAEMRSSAQTLSLQRAARDFAQATRVRYIAADREQAVAKELVDQSSSTLKSAEASVAAANANVASNRANVRRLQELTSFQRVVAPFAGTIIRRNVDEGTLITAGSPTSLAAPASTSEAVSGLFEVAQIDVLRVFVSVPQVYAPNMRVGTSAKILARGHLDEPLSGTLTRTANAIDPATRTLLVEIDLSNSARVLLPGMFVNVSFALAPAGRHWRLPATALIADAKGTRVVIVGPGDKLHFQPVVLGRDFGATLDIQGGLRGDEQIVRQPRVSLQEGQAVEPLAPPPDQQ